MTPPVRKTYFLTNKCENKFPLEFINSTNTKYIEVHPCYISNIVNLKPKQYEKNILMHGDFVQRDFYVDHALCFCNDKRSKYKKYEYRGQKDTFNLSFTSIKPTVTYNFKPDSSHKYGKPYDGVTDVFDWNTALTLLENVYPYQILEITNLYQSLWDANFKSSSGLLSKSRYLEVPLPVEYKYYDFVDHVSLEYGRIDDIQYLPGRKSSYNENAQFVEYVEVTTLYDPYLDRNFTKNLSTKYDKIIVGDGNGEYKFFAEFLLIY